jgi:isocitrate dehydrogenase
MTTKTPIVVAHGNGIGPEIMAATLKILDAAGAQLDIETIEVGEELYKKGITTGIETSSWEALRRTKVFLKAPITTPQGKGMKSLNVTVRSTLGLYANVRPCAAYSPAIKTLHPDMNVVIVRENEEGLYEGIEHRQTPEVYQSLKQVSRPGCERICHYAFDYAVRNGRKKVTCFSKDNIMKMTDGLFHQVFNEVAAEYPNIKSDHYIIDIGTARLADTPEIFDVIVAPNLYGDIISDVAAQITGSVGLAGSANVGEQCAMFEAVHGSAPDIAGKNIANPSGLLLGSVMMLIHIGQSDIAGKVHNAWLKAIEDGMHTVDIYSDGLSQAKLSTTEFADAVIERLGQQPEKLTAVDYHTAKETKAFVYKKHTHPKRELVGVDVFVYFDSCDINLLAERLKTANSMLKLKAIANRGTSVWPEVNPGAFCTDQWRCRFRLASGTARPGDVADLLVDLSANGIEVVKTESLYLFDGEPGFSMIAGE